MKIILLLMYEAGQVMNSGHRQSVVTDLGRERRTLHSQCVVWALHWEKSPQLSSLPPAAERSSLVPKRTPLSTLQVLVTFNIRWQTQRYDGAPISWDVDLQVTSGADQATRAFRWHTHVTGYFFSRVTTLKEEVQFWQYLFNVWSPTGVKTVP